jgi:DNA-binding GntR family transcriptional regulator
VRNRTDLVQTKAVDGEKSSLTQNVYEWIKEDIFDFRMAPGSRYSEQELADHFRVSRTPLRFALHMLAREGYLDKVGGHAGWVVKPFDLSYYQDLYSFRIDLEVLAVRRICATVPLPDLGALCDTWRVPKPERPTEGKRIAADDENLHSSLMALAGSQEMARVHANLTERIRIIRRLDFVSEERIEEAFSEHVQLLDALIARRADEAERLIRAHIGASLTEIKHITLHRLSLAAAQSKFGRHAA